MEESNEEDYRRIDFNIIFTMKNVIVNLLDEDT